jgi:hypothetical protein
VAGKKRAAPVSEEEEDEDGDDPEGSDENGAGPSAPKKARNGDKVSQRIIK